MQLVAILLLRHMYGKTLRTIFHHCMLSARKMGHALLKVEDCSETLPPIFPAFLQSVYPKKQGQTHGSYQQTLNVLCTITLSITV